MPVNPAVAGRGPRSGSVAAPGACGRRGHCAALLAWVRALAGEVGLCISEGFGLAAH